MSQSHRRYMFEVGDPVTASDRSEDTVQVKPVEESSARYALNSLKAYLEGEQNLNWITGIIGEDGTAREMLARLSGYGRPERRREMAHWFDSHQT